MSGEVDNLVALTLIQLRSPYSVVGAMVFDN